MEIMEINREFWLDRPTFVTGGTGLVGSWLLKRLTEAGANVTCLIRDWVPQSELIRSGIIGKVNVVGGWRSEGGGQRSEGGPASRKPRQRQA